MKGDNQFQIVIFFLTLFCLSYSCVSPEAKKEMTKESTNSQVNIWSSNIDTVPKLEYESTIYSIFQDSKGNYWFGSHREGLCLFDGKSFTYFTQEDGLAGDQIRSIQEDKKGDIWIGTDKGVSSFDGKKFLSHTSVAFLDRADNEYYLIDKKSETKWVKTKNDLWFNGGAGAGVYRFDGKIVNYLTLPANGDNDHQNPHQVTDFAQGENNRIWIATYAGVFGYDEHGFTLLNKENLNLSKEQIHIRSVFEDRKGRLWIGNNSIGVLLYHENSTINFTQQNGLSSRSPKVFGLDKNIATLEHVFAIEEDASGNIWFGDRDTGAWKYDGASLTNYNRKDGLSSSFVRVIYKDNDDQLWFGLGDGNLFKFNDERFVEQF